MLRGGDSWEPVTALYNQNGSAQEVEKTTGLAKLGTSYQTPARSGVASGDKEPKGPAVVVQVLSSIGSGRTNGEGMGRRTIPDDPRSLAPLGAEECHDEQNGDENGEAEEN